MTKYQGRQLKSLGLGLVAVACLALSCPNIALAETNAPEDPISLALTRIGETALSGKLESAKEVMSENLVLVSQSGKIYGRDAALADLGNGFIAWNNSDLIVRLQGKSAIVTFINRRQREAMDAANFRVLQFWSKSHGRWKILAQSSTRIPEQ